MLGLRRLGAACEGVSAGRERLVMQAMAAFERIANEAQ
jgi:hypothetical protein